jgi:hypothetical protein
MKQTLVMLIVVAIALLPALLIAENPAPVAKKEKVIVVSDGEELDEAMQKMEIKLNGSMAELEGKLDNMGNKNVQIKVLGNTIDMSNEAPDAPFFGIYPADLDFPKAQSLNYPNNYGVLVTGVVPSSPAYQYRLAEDDIIVEIGGKKAMNLKEFDKLKAVYRAGDAVVLTIFRDGELKNIDFVFGSRAPKTIDIDTDKDYIVKKKKLSVGHGGGTWIPMFYQADMDDVNELVQTIGFSKLPEDGILTQGLGGKGNVGKGWFIGGQLNFYNDTKKINEVIGTDNFTNSMSYNLIAGGATLDKRFAITKHIITSMGVMIGGAAHSVELVHSNGDYNWPVARNNTQDIMDNNAYANITKSYVMVQPRAEVMVRILSWLGMRAEVGYLYGYSPHSGWKVNHNEIETYELKESPDTPFQGMTVTVGPWFGF